MPAILHYKEAKKIAKLAFIVCVNYCSMQDSIEFERYKKIQEKFNLPQLHDLRNTFKFELEDSEKAEFLTDLGMDEPGLDRVIRAGYELLGLQTYFTAGVKEVRAWTMKAGDTAPKAAAVIHTDFEKGFIRAEVIAYDDFIRYNGENGAKEAGKWRLEGKDYIVKDGDVMHFRFNV